MNYARVMELPLTDLFLEPKSSDRILDVSSPKLLAVYYGLQNFEKFVTADLEDYFLSDFDAFQEHAGVKVETAVFDATERIPFEDGSFDKVYSVSVLEHIPGSNDAKAFDEILRVLSPGGTAVITLPVANEYLEEWTSAEPYWQTQKDVSGKSFYQRRYDEANLNDRFDWHNRGQMDYVLVAENPIREPEVDSKGKLIHNSYLVDTWVFPRLIRKIGRKLRKIPFTDYFAERWVSGRCHYLTRDWSDPNIRQIVFRVTKN